MKNLHKRNVKFIAIDYSCNFNDIMITEHMFIKENYIRLTRKVIDEKKHYESELNFKKMFITTNLKSKFDEIYESFLKLCEVPTDVIEFPKTEITVCFYEGNSKIIKSIPYTLMSQGFIEIVNLLLEIIPSDWFVPKFCKTF